MQYCTRQYLIIYKKESSYITLIEFCLPVQTNRLAFYIVFPYDYYFASATDYKNVKSRKGNRTQLFLYWED